MFKRITDEVKSVVRTNLFKVTSVLWSGRIISSAMGIFTNIILTRLLGLEGFGQFALILSTAVLTIGLFDPRFWETAIKYLTKYQVQNEHGKSIAILKLAYLSTFAGGILSFLVLHLISSLLPLQYLQPQFRDLVFPMSIGWFFQTTGMLSLSVMRVFNRAGVQAFYQVILSSTTLILYLVSLLVFKNGVSGIAWSYLISSGLSFIFLSTFVISTLIKKIGLSGKISLISEDYKELWHFSIHMKLHGFLRQLIDLELIVLKFFTNDFVVGVYSIAIRITSIVNIFFEPIIYAIYPEMSRSFEERNYTKLWKIVKYTAIVNPAIVMIMIVGFLFTGEFMLRFAIDNTTAFMPVLLLLISLVPMQAITWSRPLMLSIGEPMRYNIIIFSITVVRIILISLLAPLITYNSPPVAYLTTNFLMAFIFYLEAKRISRKHFSISDDKLPEIGEKVF